MVSLRVVGADGQAVEQVVLVMVWNTNIKLRNTELVTFKSPIIIEVKGSSRWWNCSLLLYRAGTNGGQGIDGAVKVFWLENVF